jgi:F420-dependent oxidoreductase-like protein
MKLDYHLMRFEWAGGDDKIGAAVAKLARVADEVGINTLSVMDHFFQMEAMAPAELPMLEGYTALGFIAAVTERLRLRLLVGGVTYRHPGLLAKTMTTLDVLSGGRAELGLGAAWYEREHKGLGVPFPPIAQRFEMLEEALQICLQMWSGKVAAYEGKHFQLAETLCQPMPVSKPRPRIMIGGGGEKKTIRMVAQYADACNFFGGPEEVTHKIEVLRGHCDNLGRDIREIEVTALLRETNGMSVDEIVRAAEGMGKAGVATVAVSCEPGDPIATLETLFGPAVAKIEAIEPKAL